MWRCVVVVVVSGASEKGSFETSEITDAASQRHFADLNSQLYSSGNFKFRSLFTACCLDGAISNWVTRMAWRENLCSFRRAVKCWYLIHVSFKLWNIWGRKEMPTGACWGNLKERDYLKDAGFDGRIILRCILLRWYARAWTGLIWFRVRTSGGLLRTQ